jgi:murein DD-endopeptidase MepM/ murein hydrolase activator NlpD
MIGPEFSHVVRPWSRFYCAAGFLAPEYHAKFGKWHRGVDLNLLTGGDSDLGYPVSSMFPGVVTASDVYGSWGGIVVVRADEWVRKMVSDRLERPVDVLEVQFAHLLHTVVDVGDTVNAGDCVGVVGKGTWGDYVAHLHMEVRAVELHPALPQGGSDKDYQQLRSQCLDPEVLLKRLPFSDKPNLLAQKAYYAPSRILGVQHEGEGAVIVHPVGDKLYLEGMNG